MFWSLAVVRGIYGAIGSILSGYERYLDDAMQTHPTEAKTYLSSILVLTHLGFFLFEWPALCYFDFRYKSFSKELHVHHVIALVGFASTCYMDMCHYTALSGFLLEMSTPFSCVCYCLIKAGMADSKIWFVNQLLLVHVFHLRSVVEMGMAFEIYKYWNEYSKISIIWRIDFFGGVAAMLFFLTPFWTYKKTKQLFEKADWNDSKKKPA